MLDPACGSRTFLFHVIRLKLAAAEAAGLTCAAAVAACIQQTRGLDVHPVAVIIARVTWLLALAPAIEDRVGGLHVPVYLGDAMQWNLRQVGDARDVIVSVPDERPLHVPAGFAEDQARFDYGLQTLAQGLQEGASQAQVERMLLRIDGVAPPDATAMADTFLRLRELYDAGRNGMWPFVLRNLTRPLWLSRPEQLADVLLGNPPWVAYRHLSAEMKPRLRAACQQMNLWVGGRLTTNQDLSALFWARGARNSSWDCSTPRRSASASPKKTSSTPSNRPRPSSSTTRRPSTSRCDARTWLPCSTRKYCEKAEFGLF